jgi:hypothetical protein
MSETKTEDRWQRLCRLRDEARQQIIDELRRQGADVDTFRPYGREPEEIRNVNGVGVSLTIDEGQAYGNKQLYAKLRVDERYGSGRRQNRCTFPSAAGTMAFKADRIAANIIARVARQREKEQQEERWFAENEEKEKARQAARDEAVRGYDVVADGERYWDCHHLTTRPEGFALYLAGLKGDQLEEVLDFCATLGIVGRK